MLGLFFIFRYFAYFILMFNLVSKKRIGGLSSAGKDCLQAGTPAAAPCSQHLSSRPVSSLGHVLTCTSPVLSLRISLMGNPVHSALLPASGVPREGGRSGIQSVNQRGSHGHRDGLPSLCC